MIAALLLALTLLSPLAEQLGREVGAWRDRRAAAVAADLEEWAAWRAAFLAARPERVAPGRRRRPVFYPFECPPVRDPAA